MTVCIFITLYKLFEQFVNKVVLCMNKSWRYRILLNRNGIKTQVPNYNAFSEL